MWLLAVIAGLAAAFGLLVGYAMIGAVLAIVILIRILVWIVLSAIALGRSYFVPPSPPSDGSYSR